MNVDIGILFNVSAISAASFFAICIDERNELTKEFLDFMIKFCIKGDREINKNYRLFTMFYVKELQFIYDFNYFIIQLNNNLNNFYDETKNNLISKRRQSALDELFSFIGEAINKCGDYLNGEISEADIFREMRDRFIEKDFINKFKKEFIKRYTNEYNLKFLDGNQLVNLIRNLDEKLPYVKQNVFELLDFRMLSDFIVAKKPLIDSLKLALYNYKKQSKPCNDKIFFIISTGESEEIKDEELQKIKYEARKNNIFIFSIYLNPKIKQEYKFYDSYRTHRKEILNLFSVSSWLRYNHPLMNFFILNGWELPISGYCKLFMEVNSKQNLYKFVDIINNFCSELNNHQSNLNQESVLNSITLATINSEVYYNIIKKFEAKDQGKTPTCYANAISASILITLSRFSDNFTISEKEYFDLRDEVIAFTQKQIKHKDTFTILRIIGKKYKFELKEVNEIGARKAIMKTRICVVRFGSTSNQWNNFYLFYRLYPKCILTKEFLGKRKEGEKLKGHAVVLTEIFLNHLYFLNSYGKNWGDNGYFRVKNAEVLNAKFMEIYIEPYNYTLEQRSKFEDLNNNIKNGISKELFQ